MYTKSKTKKSSNARKPGNLANKEKSNPTGRIVSHNIMPPKLRRTLIYVDGNGVKSAASTFLVYSMRLNDLFDPDPILLSGSVSNFKEIMQFYQYYRVKRIRVTWTVSNLETFPLTIFYVLNQSALTGTIATSADAINAYENDYRSDLVTLAAKGGIDTKEFRSQWFPLKALIGDIEQYNTLNYSGNGLASPPIPLWLNLIAVTPTGVNLTNGYANNMRIEFDSEFYGRINVRA